MILHRTLRTIRIALGLALGAGWGLTAWSADSNIGETASHEIQFCSGIAAPYLSCAASDLRAKADALGSPVAIYEYVRNNYDFALYHGARSGSINAFLGARGNDVDLAATLIAMLRSRGIPAQYVVGTVRIPAEQVKSWLAVENVDLAYGILRDQGTQAVTLAADKSTLDFEHVWVEALVPYAKYRGAGPQTVDCAATPASCNWVPLDPSFKQHKQRASGLDPYSALSFDYTAYYNALKNNDAARRDKNPLEIYQEQVLAWLQTSAPGKTLEDIPDFTDIVVEEDGLLPASLPYTTVGNLRRYNSAADHDAAVPAGEPKKWMKQVTAQAVLGGGAFVSSATVSLVDASTKQFTFTFATGTSQTFRLGGVPVGGSVQGNGSLIVGGQPVTVGYPFALVVTMDGAPAPDGNGTDETISATYNAIVGGYYLVAAGGESSNWSQVHRAAQQLLAANQQYKIVFDPNDPGLAGQPCDPTSGLNCTPYVDANNNGWDASDQKLLDSSTALDALTGGILYVAGSQYYASLRDNIARLDALNKVKSPISGFLGVVSSTHEVEYIDGTAFSVLPGGLLIDMKGIHFNGTWRIDQPSTYSNKQFELMGHIGSSLEHETWQQLTGYDAISTVRGMQMALGSGATLSNPLKNAGSDTAATMYPGFGYDTVAPVGFTRNVRTLFGQSYLSWSYSGADPSASFVSFRPNVQGMPAGDPRLALWNYSANNGIDSLLNNYDTAENNLKAAQATEGQLKTNVTVHSTVTNYQTQDVLSASVASPSGFAVASYARTGTGTYDYAINETSNHVDGTYAITLNVELGDAVNEATYGYTGFTGYQVLSLSASSPAGFSVKSYALATADQLNVTLQETSPHADGAYTINMAGVLYRNSTFYNFNLTATLKVAKSRWVDVSGTLPMGAIDVSDNTSITCAGAANGGSVTYTGTPTVLLGNLQACFNNVVQINALSSELAFFDPVAALEFRGVPATNDAQLTSKVVGMRNDLYLRDQSQGWVEYLIPSRLSVGLNYRFAVDLRKFHVTASGNVADAIYEIINESGISAGGGYVSPASLPALTPIPAKEKK